MSYFIKNTRLSLKSFIFKLINLNSENNLFGPHVIHHVGYQLIFYYFAENKDNENHYNGPGNTSGSYQ